MARYRVGWLAYGSDDEDVVLRHTLTSAPTAADLGFTTRTIIGSAGGPTHDATLGMRAWNIAAAASSCYRFDTALAALAACEQEGQLSFEVESNWLAADSTNLLESNGKAIGAASEGVFFAQHLTGTQNPLTLSKVQNAGISCRMGGAADLAQIPTIGGERLTTANAGPLVHSVGKSRFVTVNIAWWGGITGGEFLLAIDGLTCTRGVRVATGSSAGQFDRMFLGAVFDNTNCMVDHYMRNWQIAKRAPVFPINRGIGRVAQLSDSILDLMNTFSSSTYGEGMINTVALRYLQQRGVRIDGWGGVEQGGASIINAGGNQLATVRAAVRAIRPDTVIIMGGTNDLNQSIVTFEADYKDHINYFMGVGTYASSQIRAQRVLCCTMPEGSVAIASGTVPAFNDRIRSLPAWWTAAQPALVGRIAIIDVHRGLHGPGSHAPGTTYYSDGLHLNSLGNHAAGKIIGQALVGYV